MSDNNKVYSLVIQNLKMIDQTIDVLDEIQMTVFNQIDEYFERWTKSKGWECNGSYWSDIQKFYPKDWDSELSYFRFDLEDNIKNENISYLSYLTGNESIRFGIFWDIDNTNKVCKYNLTQWKQELKKQYCKNLMLFKKNKTEIVFKDKGLFIPIIVDSKLLAENYADNLDAVLENPINDALGYLDNIFLTIDKIYRDSINQT